MAQKIPEYIEQGYPHSLAAAAEETGLPRTAFPVYYPYTVEQLPDTEFLP